MKDITRKGLNFIQKIGGMPVILKLARMPYWDSLGSFWHKQSYDNYLEQYLSLREYLDDANLSISGLSVLEVGSGGSIGQGYFFVANGCKSWTATDLYSDLLTDVKWIENEKKVVDQVSKKYWQKTKSLVKFGKNKIKFECPFEFRKLDITLYDKSLRGKFDVVLSRAVFEHVDKSQVPQAIENISKYLKKGGYMIHEIDLRDHVNILNPCNFFRYEENDWDKLTKDTIFYTNRLRASDYKREFEKNGLKEIYSSPRIEKRALPSNLPISKDFQKYVKTDLSTTVMFTILVKS
jgi:2-polyprenyl-3-methyl-5-hydroxy-6-metoxy-1,4-benzoquinol methylase